MDKIATRIAVVGATGLVGQTVIQILDKENIQAEYIHFNSKNLTKQTVKKFNPDFAFFCVSADLSREWTPFFVKHGCTVIDNSSAYRRDHGVPLVVPECNADLLNRSHSIIANPNCSTIGAIVVLKPLDDRYKIKRIVYSTYQAISGAGANPTFAYPIENNLIPYIEGEEEKMVFETKKVLGRDDIEISATCVRVPIKNCHSVSINVQFEKDIDIDEINKILSSAPGVILCENLPMPIIADGRNEVFVGRVRLDKSRPNTINLFTVSDNIRKGAAFNAVQILKLLLN